MSVEQVIEALVGVVAGVCVNSGIAAIVGGQVAMVELPQSDPGTAYPALVWTPFSGVAIYPINASSGPQLKRSRVQFSALARDPLVVVNLQAAVAAAVNFQRGVIGGVRVVSILHELDGPWSKDTPTRLFERPVDYMVTFYE